MKVRAFIPLAAPPPFACAPPLLDLVYLLPVSSVPLERTHKHNHRHKHRHKHKHTQQRARTHTISGDIPKLLNEILRTRVDISLPYPPKAFDAEGLHMCDNVSLAHDTCDVILCLFKLRPSFPPSLPPSLPPSPSSSPSLPLSLAIACPCYAAGNYSTPTTHYKT